jgi:histidine triad (HIT) family protein
MDKCIFCKIIKREAPAYIVDENDNVIVFVTPENHPLIVTKKHISDLYSLDDKLASAVMIEAVKIAKAVKAALNCDGVNLVQSNEPEAGQEVFHFHLHIKPRWKGDKVTLTWEHEIKPDNVRKHTMEEIKKRLASNS